MEKGRKMWYTLCVKKIPIFSKSEIGILATLKQGKSFEWLRLNHREFFNKFKGYLHCLAHHNYSPCDSGVSALGHVNEETLTSKSDGTTF
jgi:hypothetical protein